MVHNHYDGTHKKYFPKVFSVNLSYNIGEFVDKVKERNNSELDIIKCERNLKCLNGHTGEECKGRDKKKEIKKYTEKKEKLQEKIVKLDEEIKEKREHKDFLNFTGTAIVIFESLIDRYNVQDHFSPPWYLTLLNTFLKPFQR